MSLTFTNIRILDPESGMDAIGNLRIEDGKIAEFGPNLSLIHI